MNCLFFCKNEAAALIEAYRRYATLSARAIRDWLQSDASDADIDADVAAMIRFEFALANVSSKQRMIVFRSSNSFHSVVMNEFVAFLKNHDTQFHNTGFSWVFLGFTDLYLVLLSFTGFY